MDLSNSAFERFLQALRKISDVLAERPEAALAELVEDLCAESIITLQNLSAAVQFVFISIGLLSMVYSPNLYLQHGLQLYNIGESLSLGFTTSAIGNNNINGPFVDLLKSFIEPWPNSNFT